MNQIDPACKSNPLWFDAAREALQLAVMVRNELGWDLPVAVAFSLNAAEPEPRSREDWEQPMDWTPPSFYLFEKGKEFWAEISSPAPNVAEYQAIKLDLPHSAWRWGRRILYNSYEQIPASGFGRSS